MQTFLTEPIPTEGHTIEVSEFKAKCLELIDRVASSGDEIILSKHGEPVARLVPFGRRPKSIFGIDKDSMRIPGDIIEPLDVEWEAMQGDASDHDK